MDREYYNEYYKLERSHWWFRARSEILSSQISRIAEKGGGGRVLNIGAATGATSEMLGEFGKVESLEYDAECCEFGRNVLGIPVINGSILELPYGDGEFDLVCAFDVIEHVEDDGRAIMEMLRVCKIGGAVIVSVPAYNWLWSRHDEVNRHFRRYTRESLERLLKDLSELHVTYFNSILFPPIAVIRLLSRIFPIKREGAGSDFSLLKWGWLNLALQTVFLWEKPLLRRQIVFPFGVSILGIGIKGGM